MSEAWSCRAVQPGEPAPGFELPAVTRDGIIRLGDFRGSRPVLLGLFRGLHCPFCRRQIAALGALEDELRAKGVETLGVVTTPAERARTYIRFRPTRLLLASDEERTTHRAYGLARPEITESETAWPHRIALGDVKELRLNPTGELPEPMDPSSADEYLNAKDRFEPLPEEGERAEPAGVQLIGTFLVDRDGIVRWTFLEAANDPNDFGRFPEKREILAAVNSFTT
jgi:peroxiredoxin